MSCDLLPEWLNQFLDDVETTLCLPILLIMVLCTAQFIINHAIDIGVTVYQNFIQKSDDDEEDIDKEPGEDIISKIKEFLFNRGCNANNCNPKAEESTAPSVPRPAVQEEEWDYCEEDEDEN